MKFGCYCAIKDVETVAEIGYDYVELSASEILRLSPEEYAALRKKLERCSIPCLAAADYCGDTPAMVGSRFDSQAAARYARMVCERVYPLGIRRLGVGAPLARAMPVKYAYDRALEQAVEFFRRTSDEAMPWEGLNVLVEALCTNSCNFCNSQHQSWDLVQRINRPNVLMEVDFFHMRLMAEPLPRAADFHPLIGHVHISGRTEQDQRCFFAESERNFCREAVSALKRCGYTGTMSMEVPPEAFSPQAAARSLEMLREAACGGQ